MYTTVDVVVVFLQVLTVQWHIQFHPIFISIFFFRSLVVPVSCSFTSLENQNNELKENEFEFETAF